MASAIKQSRRARTRSPRTREVPMTLTADRGWIPTHIVQREMVAEAVRIGKADYPESEYARLNLPRS